MWLESQFAESGVSGGVVVLLCLNAIHNALIQVGSAQSPDFAAEHDVVAVMCLRVSTPDGFTIASNQDDTISWNLTAINHAGIILYPVIKILWLLVDLKNSGFCEVNSILHMLRPSCAFCPVHVRNVRGKPQFNC